MKIIQLEDHGIYDVSNAKGSQIYLVVGSEHTAIIDSGMGYSSEGLIENIKKILKDRTLDYVLLSHSHYDHVSGIPALRKVWPELKVYGGAYVKHVFESEKAKKVIGQLNMDAMRMYHADGLPDFTVDALEVHEVIREGSEISLGDHVLTAYETPGHTRCSMAYLMDDTYLFASETTCVISHYGTYIPNYLVSYKDSEESIKKCAALPMRYVLVPHSYIYDLNEKPDFWDFCMTEMKKSKDIILSMNQEGKTVEEIIEKFDELYRDEDTRQEQPLEAFMINQKSLIGAVIREFN